MEAVNSLLSPLKPPLRTLTHSLPTPLHSSLISLLGPDCHASLLLDLNLTSTSAPPDTQLCLSLAASKALGLAIVAASSIVKLPQLLTLTQSRSARGVSLTSYLLETAAFLITLAYNTRRGFAFSTFGETALICVQNLVIIGLLLACSGRGAYIAGLVAALAVSSYALFTPDGLVGLEELAWLQAGAGVLGVAAKVPQIVTVWREGGTGQLSGFAVGNYLLGSLARVFTTMAEVKDPLILGGFVVGACLNGVLAGQVLWYDYLHVKKDGQEKRETITREKVQGDGMGERRSTGRVKGPSTRRRG